MTTASGGSGKQQSRSGGRGTKRPQRSTASTSDSGPERHRQNGNATTVELPFVTAQFHTPEIHLPTGKDLTSAAQTVREQLPSREQGLFYGGLAVSAAFAVIDWPVAMAIGVGHALLSRSTHEHGTSATD